MRIYYETKIQFVTSLRGSMGVLKMFSNSHMIPLVQNNFPSSQKSHYQNH